MESIRLSTTLATTPEDAYDAWLSSKRHAAMTGSAATSEKRKGGSYTAWDGYISGKHLELDPGKRILQTWRTTEFPGDAPDSRLEVRFSTATRGTKLTLLQSGIPDGQGEMYAEGWQEKYFEPMFDYFGKLSPPGPAKRNKSVKAKAKAKASAKEKAKAKAKAKPGSAKGSRRPAGAPRSKAKSPGKKAPRARTRA